MLLQQHAHVSAQQSRCGGLLCSACWPALLQQPVQLHDQRANRGAGADGSQQHNKMEGPAG